jgi:hypothetical protein
MEKFLVDNKNEIIEAACFSAMPVMSIISACRGLKSWLKFEVFSTILFALVCIFCPNTIFKHILNVKLDSYHLNIFTVFGAVLIGSTLYQLFLLDSNDENVFTSHLWGATIANILSIMVIFQSYKLEKSWNYKLLCTFGSACIFKALINGYFYLQNCKPRTHSTFNDCINFYVRVETFKSFVYGLVFFALPELVVYSAKQVSATNLAANETHKALYRYIGIAMFSMGLQAQGVTEFMYLKDKKTFILSRLIHGLITMQAVLVGYYYYNSVSIGRVLMFIASYVMYNAFLAVGYFSAKMAPVKSD